MDDKKIVIIGGGNGTSTLLSGFRDAASLTAIVSMADNGGSTGMLRRELGVSPPGDVRRCLVALSDNPHLGTLFSYRFGEGELEGQSFGNLFLAAAQRTTGTFENAIHLAEEILGVQGKVLPVTDDDVQLVAEQDGREITGVYEIAGTPLRKPQLRLEPPATISPSARRAIADADFVIIAPGNLYGSLAPALLVGGMREALDQTKARVVYVCNLVNRDNHMPGFKVGDYAAEIERFIGAPVLDYVLYNIAPIPDEAVRQRESVVGFDEVGSAKASYQARGIALVDRAPVPIDPNDKIPEIRSLVRHDAHAVAQTLMEL